MRIAGTRGHRGTRTSGGTAAGFVLLLVMVLSGGRVTPAALTTGSFEAGDVFVSLHSGQVQWRDASGGLKGILPNTVPGKAEGMGFDASMNLYVTHHCADTTCLTGNGVERFSPMAVSLGTFGAGYNCNPNSVVFDDTGSAFVGQADCSGDVLKFDPTGLAQGSFDAAPESRGTAWIDLAADGCTLFYTSQSTSVKRFNVCANVQLPDFNTSPLPDVAAALRVLPGGGVLVAANSVILRLDSAGNVARTYDAPGYPDLWLGLDLAADGSFWASNYGSADVVRFDLDTGSVLTSFNTGTGPFTVKGVAVRRAPGAVSSRGRMTGGGSIFTDSGMRVTHGFELHCDPDRNPNNLEVNWGQGKQFHLEHLAFAECSDDPLIAPNPPGAPFDTYRGRGTGRYDGADGATAEWTLTDAGEPGRNDRFSLTVRDAAGNLVLAFSNKPLTYGNHQAHK